MLAHFAHELQALVGPRIAGEEYVAVMVLSIARTAAKLPFCLRRQKIVLHSLFVFVFFTAFTAATFVFVGSLAGAAPGIVVTSPPADVPRPQQDLPTKTHTVLHPLWRVDVSNFESSCSLARRCGAHKVQPF